MPTTPPVVPRCTECGAPFPADAHPDRITCSQACRARRYRRAEATRRASEIADLRRRLAEAEARHGRP